MDILSGLEDKGTIDSAGRPTRRENVTITGVDFNLQFGCWVSSSRDLLQDNLKVDCNLLLTTYHHYIVILCFREIETKLELKVEKHFLLATFLNKT